MTKFKTTGLVVLLITIAVLSGAGGSRAQEACTPYTVDVPILQVLKDPNQPGVYISTLEQGDIACISADPVVGPQQLGYVVEKTDGSGALVEIGGWASVIFMTRQSAEAAPAPAPAAAAPAPAPAPSAVEPTPATAPSENEVATALATTEPLHFDQPVPYGASPVRGQTLQQLIEGKPIFPPIEGLPEALWQKTCSSCHQWNKERLCEQGQSYLPRVAAVFRHPHPYGGPYKLALMRWANTGCK